MKVAAVWCCLLVVLAGCASAPPDAGTPAPGAKTPSDASATAAAETPPRANGTLSVHVIEVGQSSSTLVVGPTGETMLIDSGDYADDGKYVLAYLERHGIDRIDHLVTSHADADHIGGHAAIIERYETQKNGIGAVYDPGIAASTRTYEEYLDAVERHDVSLYELHAGDPLRFAGVRVRVLGPPEPYIADRERNDNGIVLELTYGNTSFLLTGDAERAEEHYLVERYGTDLNATVMPAGHHGSRSSTTGALLDAATPAVVPISSAYDSRYGHPHEETLHRLAERSIPVYWTATHGDIAFVSDGETVTVSTQRAAPTDPLDVRNAPPVEPGTADPLELRRTIGPGTPTAPRVQSNAGNAPETNTSERRRVVADGGRPTSAPSMADDSGGLALAEVHADAAGDDAENPNDEYLTFENDGQTELDVSGWTVGDGSGHAYTVPDGTTLAPGARVTLHTGTGSDGRGDLYWGASGPVWNNDGDTVVVTNREGERVLRETYP